MKSTMAGLVCLMGLGACGSQDYNENRGSFLLSREFKDYWYAGVAELTSFELEQVRYGEIRQGVATAIFVTEDFSKSRLVKLDHPGEVGSDKVNVLKFNLNKEFTTGVYDYSLMQSVFKPVDLVGYPHALRVTTTNIEWCGQFLTRTELKGDHYQVRHNSYFDGMEDKTVELPTVILEDEIWNWIRLDPSSLPRGEVKIIPGILTQELTHQDLEVMDADCKLVDQDSLTTYTVSYPAISRELSITFENIFPYRITAWSETFRSYGKSGPVVMTTRATRIKHTLLDYWNKRFNEHKELRARELGLVD